MLSKKSIAKLSVFIFLFIFACTLQEPKITKTTLSSNEKMLFSRYMALGDNFVSGYQNAALRVRDQKYSFPALIAKQGETPDFQQPLIANPGIGPETAGGFGGLELKYLDNPNTPNTVNPDPKIYAAAYADYPGFDINMVFVSEDVMLYPLPYSNLGVPGIIVEDVLIGKTKLHSRSHSPMLDVILRNPLPDPYGELSPFEQAKLFVPSLITCWIGTYDVLGFARLASSSETPLSAPTSKENFVEHYSALMDSLKKTGAALVVANVPDILDMPYFNLVPGVVIDTLRNAPLLVDGNPVPLIGVNEGDKIVTQAKFKMKEGYGIPVGILNGNGEPLPENMVLDSDEIEQIQSSVTDYNNAIDSVCSARGIPVVDMYSYFKQMKDGVQTAGTTVTDAFISGGFYSLDGIHPSSLGNALIANEWLNVINKSFHVTIPAVDVVQLMNELQPQAQAADTAYVNTN